MDATEREAIRAGFGDAAVELITTLLERSARESASIFEGLYQSEKAAHDRTKEELHDAQEQLRRAQRRLLGVLA